MHQKKFIPLLIWLLPLSFFAFQFILRVCPAIFMADIMNKFQINALSFGVLSACYYIGYAGCQIPLGILLDKYNPCYIISIAILTCAIGGFIFATTNSWPAVLLARFLIGAGSAVAFLGTAKIIRLYFADNQYSMMIGLTFTIGLIGAIYGGQPLNNLNITISWEKITIGLAIISCLIASLMLIATRITIKQDLINSSLYKKQLLAVLTNHRLWLLGLFGGLMVGPLEGFADVWGVSYLTQIKNLDKSAASKAVSLIFVGMCFGGPILSYLVEKFNCHYQLTASCALLMASLFFIIIYVTNLDYVQLSIIFFIIGILCCYQVIIFTIATKIVTPNLLGVATAVINTINMAFGLFFHLIIGFIMNNSKQGLIIYDQLTFKKALMVIPIAASIGGIGFLYKRLYK